MKTLVASLLASSSSLLVPLMRIGLCSWLAYERLPGIGERVGKLLSTRPAAALDSPLVEGLASALGLTMSPSLANHLGVVAAGAAACAIVGLATRPALLIFAASFMLLMGVQSGYGFFNHTPALPAQLLFTLAVVPGATSLSVDRALLWWWRRRRDPSSAPSWREAQLPPTPRFGAILVLLNVGVVYAAAGYAKLRYGAFEWLNGETLSFYLSTAAETQYWLRDEHERIVAYSYMASPSSMALRVSGSVLLCALLAWASLLLELLAPVLLVWRWWSTLLWCISAIVFHSVIRQWMNIGFVAWIVVDVVIIVDVVIDGAPAALAWFRRRGRPGP